MFCSFYDTDGNGEQNRYGMIQYYFHGPEIEIKIKPHGNSKLASPYFRTSDSARKVHKELASKNMPKEAVYQATLLQGGEIEAKGMSSLPRNHQQFAKLQKSREMTMSSIALCWSVS